MICEKGDEGRVYLVSGYKILRAIGLQTDRQETATEASAQDANISALAGMVENVNGDTQNEIIGSLTEFIRRTKGFQ